MPLESLHFHVFLQMIIVCFQNINLIPLITPRQLHPQFFLIFYLLNLLFLSIYDIPKDPKHFTLSLLLQQCLSIPLQIKHLLLVFHPLSPIFVFSPHAHRHR